MRNREREREKENEKDREIKLKIDDSKPHLKRAITDDPAKAKEVMATFVEMMEHAFAYGWADLPKQFHPDLTFKRLIHDILHGVLDLKDIDPKYYDTLGVAVHPFGLFSYQVVDIDSPTGFSYLDWQRYFDWQSGNLPEIQSILRKLLYYARYIEIDKLGQALWQDKIDVYLTERDPTPLLLIQPALRYQREKFGSVKVGKLMDKFGLFDCGDLPNGSTCCPACKVGGLRSLPEGTGVMYCGRCGAGFHVDNADAT